MHDKSRLRGTMWPRRGFSSVNPVIMFITENSSTTEYIILLHEY